MRGTRFFVAKIVQDKEGNYEINHKDEHRIEKDKSLVEL